MKPIVFFFAALITLSGCDNQSKSSHSVNVKTTDYRFDAKKSSWLRNHLPAQTLAYVSIPSLWNALFDPKADSLHPIQAHPAFQNQVSQIKNSAVQKYLKLIPKEQQPLVNILAKHQSGPLEMATLNYSPSAMMPVVATATTFNDLPANKLDDFIQSTLKLWAPQIKSQVEHSGDLNKWQFQVQGISNLIQYNEQTGQLLVLSGLGASENKISQIWQNKSDHSLNQIIQLDQQADPSGLNLKAWVAVQKFYDLGAAFLPPQQRAAMEKLAVDQMEYLWFGMESAAGKSALSMHVLMPETGWRLLLPRNSESFDVALAGRPESVVQMALPTTDQIKAAVDLLGFSNQENEIWSTISDRFTKVMGFDAADLLNAYNQNLYMVSDQSGRWLALKIKNPSLHNNIFNQFSSVVKSSADSQKLAGVEINQMHFSGLLELFLSQDNSKNSKDIEQISQVLGMFKQHSYWVREGDVIYFAAVPQILAEKFNSKQTQPLSNWLDHNQQVNWDSAILAYGKEIDHLPKDIYHIYLSVIQMLGDVAGTHVDLFQLPTASELNLPNAGRMNMALSSNSEKVSLTLAYEYSVLEGFLNSDSNMMSMYTIAILMAYAVPAYRDYTVRAKVGSALAQASAHKLAVSEHAINTGSLQGIDTTSLPQTQGITVDPESGTIVIQLRHWESQLIRDGQVYLIPQMTEQGYIEWRCESNTKHRYLPRMCQNNH